MPIFLFMLKQKCIQWASSTVGKYPDPATTIGHLYFFVWETALIPLDLLLMFGQLFD